MKKLFGLTILCIILSGFCTSVFTGCTANQRAKNFGGTVIIELPPGEKFVNCTWKDAELWYVSRPMNDSDVAETFTFSEKSSFGIVEGKTIFKETAKP